MSFEIAKAGWVYRLSSVRRRWKRNWFVLYTDGILKYFKNPNSHVEKESYVIPKNVLLIKTGSQVTNVAPPPGLDVCSLLMLVFVGNQTLTMCAESLDDMRAWQISLDQARAIRMADNPPPYTVAPPPYSPRHGGVVPGYAGQTYYGSYPPQYVVQQPGTTIIYVNPPGYYYRRGYRGTDVAMGVVGGAAVGSLLLGPMLWW